MAQVSNTCGAGSDVSGAGSDVTGAGSKTGAGPAPHFGLPSTSNGAGSGHKIGPAPFNMKPAPVIPCLPHVQENTARGNAQKQPKMRIQRCSSTRQCAKTAQNAHPEMLQHNSTWPRPKSWEAGPGHVLKKQNLSDIRQNEVYNLFLRVTIGVDDKVIVAGVVAAGAGVALDVVLTGLVNAFDEFDGLLTV